MSGLDWRHAVAEIPGHGPQTLRVATDAQRAGLKQALGVLECGRLEVRYRLRLISEGRVKLDGSVEADVIQECVVSLEPITARLKVPLDITFAPHIDPDAETTDLGDPFDVAETEPIESGLIDVGRVVLEELASAMDPYPRKDGAAFDWQDPATEAQRPDNPFAKLAALKKREPGT